METEHFYAVSVGRRPGIYRTRGECAEQTRGYEGARYRMCASFQGAVMFISEETIRTKKRSVSLKFDHTPPRSVLDSLQA